MSNESWRPRLHIAPYRGSISDPNGLCQFKGTYHFFCQNAPEYPGNFESPHGWGHFASRDLVNWVFLGCHVMPDVASDRDGSYSGGAWVNEKADELWLYYTGNIRDGVGDGTTSGRLANQTLMKSYNGIHLGPKEVVLDNSGYPVYCSCHVRDPKVWEQDGTLHDGRLGHQHQGKALWLHVGVPRPHRAQRPRVSLHLPAGHGGRKRP